MNPTVETKAKLPDAEDPYRYGWRYVRREGPDGTVNYEQVPLKEEDLLYPEEDDFVVHTEAHHIDRHTIGNALEIQAAKHTNWKVLDDHRVDWEVKGIKALGPDLVVFEGVVDKDPNVGTFYVAESGANTVLVVEVVSPSTRDNDLGIKVELYERCGVPIYVIVDRPTDKPDEVQLLAYRATPRGYARFYPDDRGWLWLEPVRMWLAIEDGFVACYDENEKRFETYQAVCEERDNKKIRADAAEQRIRDLEAELQRLRGKG